MTTVTGPGNRLKSTQKPQIQHVERLVRGRTALLAANMALVALDVS